MSTFELPYKRSKKHHIPLRTYGESVILITVIEITFFHCKIQNVIEVLKCNISLSSWANDMLLETVPDHQVLNYHYQLYMLQD